MAKEDKAKDAEIEVMENDAVKELHEFGVSQDYDAIFLEASQDSGDPSGVDWAMATRFQKNLLILMGNSQEAEITVHINCPGGYEHHGMAIYDAIRSSRNKIKGIVSSEASSMGSVILQACDDRVVMPNACVMYHAGQSALEAPTQEFRSAYGYQTKLNDQIDKIMFDRAKEKQPGLTWDRFEVMVMKGIYLTAQEAVDFGWADRIAEYPKKK